MVKKEEGGESVKEAEDEKREKEVWGEERIDK